MKKSPKVFTGAKVSMSVNGQPVNVSQVLGVGAGINVGLNTLAPHIRDVLKILDKIQISEATVLHNETIDDFKPLEVESLEKTLKAVACSMKDLKLWAPKKKKKYI